MFATLDPRTRRLSLPGGEIVLLSDTVGFVRKLPHQLVEAFRSTLEVVAESDLLVHVVDISSHDMDTQIAAVHEVLEEIEADKVTEMIVFNKSDLVDLEVAEAMASIYPGSMVVSAASGYNVEALAQVIAHRLRALAKTNQYFVPYERGDVLAAIHREGMVINEEPSETGVAVTARLDDAGVSRFAGVATGFPGVAAFAPTICIQYDCRVSGWFRSAHLSV